MDPFFEKIHFPYESVRAGQDVFIKKVFLAIKQNKNLMVSAPTGLGKTVSGLAPALKIAKKKGLTVICLTSRQTQANQIIKTVKDISATSHDPINFMAFIGKRSMCVHPERDLYPAADFNEFCKKARETGKCRYYKNMKDDEQETQIKAILDETSKNFMTVEGFVQMSGTHNFCPYEMAKLKAFKTDLVVCDFNYLFSSSIRENFLGQIGRTLEECIIIVDEAHNLPDRIRNSQSFSLSTEMLKNALKELQDFYKDDKYDGHILNLKATIEDIYFDKVLGDKTEYLMGQKEFVDTYLGKFSKLGLELGTLVDDLRDVERKVKEERVISFCGRVANFLEAWQKYDEQSYLRMLEKDVRSEKTYLALKLKCIDPSEVSGEVLNHSYSSILMSGTLSPIEMYRDVLGVGNCHLLELESPFSAKRQLTMVIDDVTTKYSARSEDMYKKIAQNIESILHAANGKNAIIFFSSYDLLERVTSIISFMNLGRKILKEQRYMTKEQKEDFVELFKSGTGSFDDKPKVLFGITSGSFAEGLDLPSSALELVVVVGLPLGVPDITTQAVIAHYDKKFRKGQLYGYIQPAMSKIIQAAGRCIRTEADRGVVVLMDSRYIWPSYALNFPPHWRLQVPQDPFLEIANFFDKSQEE